MKRASKKAYFNPAQLYVHEISANSKTIVGARRFGKSDGVEGPDLLYDVQNMAGSSGFLYQRNFKQLLGKTLPATFAFWKRYGYKRDVHYFVGRKAPKWMNFKLPSVEPVSWDQAIHLYNGTIIYLLSQDVKFSANSLTTDWGKIDEARSIHKEKLFEEVIPTLSGTDPRFENCHKWKGFTIVSDMPTNKEGQWVLETKNRMDPEVISAIEDTIAHINYLRDRYKHMPELPASAQREIDYHRAELFFLRKNAYLYKEYDTIENLEIVGVDYIRKMKRDLPPVIFYTSIGNKQIRKLTDGFYPNLEPSIHYYDADNTSYIDNLRTEKGTLDLDKIAEDNCLKDGDIDPDVPLAIACDYNANINWVVTGQRVEPEMRTLSSKYVKFNRKLRELMKDWCDYYSYILNKDVIYYYNSQALDGAYADENAQPFFEIVIEELEKRGWNVEAVYIGQQWKHSTKHQAIDDALQGKKHLFPKFNKANNPSLLPAMEMTGTRNGRTGFEKDKAGEKLGETEDDPLELRTDGTDAWDDLFIGLNFFPRQVTSLPASTVFNND